MSICRYAKIGQPYGFYNEYRHDAESASDVYMYEHCHGFIACQECKLGGSQDHEPNSTAPFVKIISFFEAHNHLLDHKAAGHAVPQSAINSCKANADAGEKLEPSLCDVPLGSAEISWVIENITKESSLLELAEAVKKYGSKLFEINGDYTAQTIEELRRYATGKTVIFDGSINMAELVIRDVPAIRAIGTPQNYLCSRYYPKCHDLLFNDKYALMRMSEIESAEKLAVDGCVFVRPDGGQKQFQAGLVEVGELDALKLHVDMTVLVSPPKNLTGEWRCVCDAYGIVAVSSYRINGKPIREPSAPSGALAMCEKVSARYLPDPLFVVDVCADNDGNFWLMELNQFTGAGLYACDKAAIVRAVERVVCAFPPNPPIH